MKLVINGTTYEENKASIEMLQNAHYHSETPGIIYMYNGEIIPVGIGHTRLWIDIHGIRNYVNIVVSEV